MSTLVEIVRTKTGAADADVTDARIIEALDETSVSIDAIMVDWLQHPSGAQRREGRIAIGKYLVEATDAEDSVDPILLHDASGDALAVLSTTQRGVVTASGTASLPIAYATGRAYDVHAAAAEIVEELLVLERGSYDFKRGDQSFARSQRVSNLEGILRRLKAKKIPRRRGETVMRDQAESTYWPG
ncbi:MAG: hypothetical protein E6R04_10370 [Spirochaetes bacterium]|nr:MAG: hypothetical protein E6R04_10370 [Spirochaetota bacterium]